MRYATVTLRWTDGQLHPVDDVFAREDAIAVEAIHYVSPGPTGQYVELLELRGDLDRAATVLEAASDVLAFDITGSEGRGVAYVQCRTAGLVSDLLATLHDHEIVVDWPVHYREDATARGLRLTVLGTDRAIQQAVADLPPTLDLTLDRIGEYEPETGRLSGLLTDRQLEVLDVAVRAGYYEIPRRTTHRELAAELDLATGTVSEHLQRIESKLVSAHLGGRTPTPHD
ncbi:Predicted DNA binding protein, contains HTH domain [Halogranum amylolyticum]|uniref:Predicted DNA binding protein, contains HTH domain n=1 Tax=Halogranum amylolyticum TaxID=660520 RepID=A0A1H8UT80_9EURY|nr:helix-turn-helix domain-containing protein [Halogranum amylolyticum]SEP06336.1 Predicted DNA binding protein, contains HTH domain [Halogranum amylolyticum]